MRKKAAKKPTLKYAEPPVPQLCGRPMRLRFGLWALKFGGLTAIICADETRWFWRLDAWDTRVICGKAKTRAEAVRRVESLLRAISKNISYATFQTLKKKPSRGSRAG